MKRLSKFIIALVLTLVAGFSVSACGKNEVTSAKVISGLDYSIVRNKTIDTSNVKVMATYSKGDTKTFTSSDLSFSEISTEELGEQTLTITIDPENFKFDVKINVVATEADVNAITQLESELLTEFKANRSIDANSKEGFYDQTQPLRVGDDNAFDFRLKVSGIATDGNTLIEDIQSVRTIVKVEMKEGNDYVELTPTSTPAIETMVDVNSINAVLDFTEQAIGHDFRVTVTAKNPDEDYDLTSYSFTANLTVIDGFNVYDATDLSIFDNYNVEGNARNDYAYKGSGWTAYHEIVKSRYNMTDDQIKAVKTFIFQDDIEITAENVREDVFWKEGQSNYEEKQGYTNQTLAGTPHNSDGKGIFQRSFEDGEQVSIVGNYFAINASTFPLMVVGYDEDGVNCDTEGNGEGITSYFSLFRCEPKEKEDRGNLTTRNCGAGTKMTYDTLSFIGNAPVSGDVRKSGGLCLMKHRVMDLYGYNTTAQNFYITYYFDLGNPNLNEETGKYDNGNFVVEKCKGYDSYQSLLYLYGARFTTIIDSEFKTAGGPAILIDSLENDDEIYEYDGRLGPVLNLVNSTFESLVSGEEPWFNEYNAGTAVGLISLYDKFLRGDFYDENNEKTDIYENTETTIIADTQKGVNRINIVAIIMDGGKVLSNPDRLSGGIFMFDDMDEYKTYYGLDGKTPVHNVNGMNLDGITAGLAAGEAIPIYKDVEVEKKDENGNVIYGENGEPEMETIKVLDKYVNSTGAPIFECVETGTFFTMPWDPTTPSNPLIEGGIGGSRTMSENVLVGLFASLNKVETDSETVTGFKNLYKTNAEKLGVIKNAISVTLPAQIEAGYGENAEAAKKSTLNDIYQGIKVYCPIPSWDATSMTSAEMITAICNALDALVAKDTAGFTGNYVNLYLPVGTFGGIGAVIGLYPNTSKTPSTND